MRITFDNTPSSNVDKVTTGYRAETASTGKAVSGYALDISGTVTDNTAYGVHGRTAEEVMQAAGSQDVAVYRNYMTVMSNSMSDEDFARLQREGYNPTDTDIDTAVTIVDTIKAELVKAGVNIVGYTDDLDAEKLAEITGSMAYAEQLAGAFAAEDVPVTEGNAVQAMEAFHRGENLGELSEGAVKYMVTNHMEPDIDNLYLAQHAGAVDADRQGQGFFRDDTAGYFAKKAEDGDLSGIRDQVEKVVARAGYPVTEKIVQDAFWLIEKGIALDEESLGRLEELKQVELPAPAEKVFEAIAGAIAEGKPAGEANLADGKSVYRKAADCLASYEKKYQELLLAEETPDNIKARRQLEEVRLHMTVEANVKLLRSGFSIDTAPIEETIDALKKLESGQTDKAERTPADICEETLHKTREIPTLPYVTLGRLISLGETLCVNQIHETGKLLQESFRQANEAYETMMTVPRKDLGDNISTAFRNLDELLENMGVELTDENRKAARSISYNHMELTEETLLAVRDADRVVQRVVEKMTPPAVLGMIRKGINPLEASMEELDEWLSEQDIFGEESEKYSRFLYHLEKSGEITEEEKESYIGIYRLLRQIEKSDGAAVGKLVDTQAEINFSNLLSAVRTGRVRGVDISVNDEFGSLQEALEKGVSIDSQIDSAYGRSVMEQIRRSDIGDDTIRFLKNLEEPVTMDNLLAAEACRKDGAAPFRKLEKTQRQEQAERIPLSREFAETAEALSEEKTYADRESFENAYGEMIRAGESLARELAFSEADNSIDVRALQLVCKQIHIQGVRGAREEEYDLPQIIEGELTSIHLKLVHDSGETGKFTVAVDTEPFGRLAGEFTLTEGVVSGFFAADAAGAEELLEQAVGIFASRLADMGFLPGTIQAVQGNLNGNYTNETDNKIETRDLYKAAGGAVSAMKAALADRIAQKGSL